MTDKEVEQMLIEWACARGGVVTDEDFESLYAVLEEHFPDVEKATLEEARQVLGLTGNRTDAVSG